MSKDKETLVYNEGKKELLKIFQWLDEDFLLEMVKVMEKGAEKYEKDNWKGGTNYSHRINSALRHLVAFAADKQDIDEELNTPHLANAAINCMFIHYWQQHNKGKDDR